MSYSQNDEEAFIVEFFKNQSTGRFLDIGAYDGIQLSNTRRLLEFGWSGVLVEPSAYNFCVLMANNRQYAARVILVQAAVSEGRPVLNRLYLDETANRAWSTTINPNLLHSILAPSAYQVWVPTIPIDSLARFGPYDFISIDAEWEDMAILQNMPTSILDKCQLICIEPNGLPQRAEMKPLLSALGFEVVHETLENILAGRRL